MAAVDTALQDFVSSRLGKCIDLDGFFGCQCVDLADDWGNVLNHPLPRVNGAIDFASRSDIAGWTWVDNTPTNAPSPGCLIVWGKAVGPYGHIAICVSADVNGFTSLDQNWTNFNAQRGSPAATIAHTYNGVLGWLVPSEPNTNGGNTNVASVTRSVKLLTPVSGNVFQDSAWKDWTHVSQGQIGGNPDPADVGQECRAGTAVSVTEAVQLDDGSVYDRISDGAWCLSDAAIDLGGKSAIQIYDEQVAAATPPPAPQPPPLPVPPPVPEPTPASVPEPTPAPEPSPAPTPEPAPSSDLSDRDAIASLIELTAKTLETFCVDLYALARSVRGTSQ